jgi:hypothetical protein
MKDEYRKKKEYEKKLFIERDYKGRHWELTITSIEKHVDQNHNKVSIKTELVTNKTTPSEKFWQVKTLDVGNSFSHKGRVVKNGTLRKISKLFLPKFSLFLKEETQFMLSNFKTFLLFHSSLTSPP